MFHSGLRDSRLLQLMTTSAPWLVTVGSTGDATVPRLFFFSARCTRGVVISHESDPNKKRTAQERGRTHLPGSAEEGDTHLKIVKYGTQHSKTVSAFMFRSDLRDSRLLQLTTTCAPFLVTVGSTGEATVPRLFFFSARSRHGVVI